MQIHTRPFVDSNPTISPFFLKPSVLQCLSSFGSSIEETLCAIKPAPVFPSASLWRSAKDFRHGFASFSVHEQTRMPKNLLSAKDIPTKQTRKLM
jgi:hypothetical protein